MPSILSFYQDTVPRGKPVVFRNSWVSGTTPDLLINPPASQIFYISEIIIAVSADFVLNDNIDFTGWDDGADSPTDLQVGSLAELLALGEPSEIVGPTPDIITTKIQLHPPLKLTDAGGETLNIENSAGVAATLTGTAEFTVKGWKVSEAND